MPVRLLKLGLFVSGLPKCKSSRTFPYDHLDIYPSE